MYIDAHKDDPAHVACPISWPLSSSYYKLVLGYSEGCQINIRQRGYIESLDMFHYVRWGFVAGNHLGRRPDRAPTVNRRRI